jgi:hypothetical protein
LGLGIVALLALIITLLALTSNDINDEQIFLTTITDEWKQRLNFYPDFAAEINQNTDYPNQFTNYSSSSLAQRNKYYLDLYAKINSLNFDSFTDPTRFNADIYNYSLSMEVEGQKYLEILMHTDQLQGKYEIH